MSSLKLEESGGIMIPDIFLGAHFPGSDGLIASSFQEKTKKTLSELLRILLSIWKHESNYPHYFTTQIIYNHLIQKKGFPRFTFQSDVPVHFLQKYANETYNKETFDEIKRKYPIQKMNWKIESTKIATSDTFFNHLFHNTKDQIDLV